MIGFGCVKFFFLESAPGFHVEISFRKTLLQMKKTIAQLNICKVGNFPKKTITIFNVS